MEVRDYESLKTMLCEELEPIVKKRTIVRGELDAIQKLVETIKDVGKIIGMEMEAEEYSQNSNRSGGYSRRRDSYSYESRGGSGDSYANRRGTHYVRGHYSRAEESMADEIEDMISEGNMSQEDEKTLRRALEVLRK